MVLGVGDYQHVDALTKPAIDEQTIRDKLGPLGFQVAPPIVSHDRDAILKAFDDFAKTLKEGDIALFYFSGHAVERDGTNYLIPADTKELTPGREGLQAVDVQYLMGELEEKHVGVAIIILDACRKNPFPGVASTELIEEKGLAPIDVRTSGVFIGYAAAPHESSWGGTANEAPGTPSVFTRFLADEIPRPGKSLYRVWLEVGRKVLQATQSKQRPWHSASIFPELKLKAIAVDYEEAEAAWAKMIRTATEATLRSSLEDYLSYFPDSPYAPAALAKLAELRAAPVPGPDLRSTLGSPPSPVQLPEVEFTGALFSTSIAATPTDRLKMAAAEELVLRAEPTDNSPALATVAVGAELQALALPDARGWVPVRLPGSGLRGFISSVSAVRVPRRSSAVGVHFDKTERALGPINRRQLAAVVRQAGESDKIITADIGRPEGLDPDRALTLSYLRALEIKAALVAAGASSEQIRLRISEASEARGDKAVIAIANWTDTEVR